MMSTALLRCVLCPERFTLDDAVAGRYFIQTLICRACYERLRAKPYALSCFGKGYDSQDEVCQHICPDRKICHALK